MNTLFDMSKVQQLLCIGAHCDDIEIGAGGLIMRLINENPNIHVCFVVLTGGGSHREHEARQSAALLTEGAAQLSVEVLDFTDAFLSTQYAEVKQKFEALKQGLSPDLILSHYQQDKHQDHRLVSELTYNTWRDHNILEYEILKWDGDIGRPNIYVSLSEELANKKTDIIYGSFASQHPKTWFRRETFDALMRVRGVESNCQFAEAFYANKLKW